MIVGYWCIVTVVCCVFLFVVVTGGSLGVGGLFIVYVSFS